MTLKLSFFLPLNKKKGSAIFYLEGRTLKIKQRVKEWPVRGWKAYIKGDLDFDRYKEAGGRKFGTLHHSSQLTRSRKATNRGMFRASPYPYQRFNEASSLRSPKAFQVKERYSWHNSSALCPLVIDKASLVFGTTSGGVSGIGSWIDLGSLGGCIN